MKYRSDINENTSVARPGEFAPLKIGSLEISPPIVLAPMAGITNAPFRTLCRQFGAGLYVSEMVTARLLVEKDPYTMKLASFAPDESPRSIQLYSVDPYYIGEAVAWLVGEGRVDHIDLNFGCPVRKVTRKGGGAAIPLKPNLLRNLVRAAVQHAGNIPVTIKFRIGISDQYETYLTAGKIAEEEGCASVALHARTAAELYSGEAHWEKIAILKETVKTIPVLGNGDIWEGLDALRMMRATGCDGVVVGRGCLGRPWLFRDLADVFQGKEPSAPPALGEVADIMLQHATMLCDWYPEPMAVKSFRKHCIWYINGFRNDPELRSKLMQTNTLDELRHVLENVDKMEPFPLDCLRDKRGKTRPPQKVVLPIGYLENLEDTIPPSMEAEAAVSGG